MCPDRWWWIFKWRRHVKSGFYIKEFIHQLRWFLMPWRLWRRIFFWLKEIKGGGSGAVNFEEKKCCQQIIWQMIWLTDCWFTFDMVDRPLVYFRYGWQTVGLLSVWLTDRWFTFGMVDRPLVYFRYGWQTVYVVDKCPDTICLRLSLVLTHLEPPSLVSQMPRKQSSKRKQ